MRAFSRSFPPHSLVLPSAATAFPQRTPWHSHTNPSQELTSANYSQGKLMFLNCSKPPHLKGVNNKNSLTVTGLSWRRAWSQSTTTVSARSSCFQPVFHSTPTPPPPPRPRLYHCFLEENRSIWLPHHHLRSLPGGMAFVLWSSGLILISHVTEAAAMEE